MKLIALAFLAILLTASCIQGQEKLIEDVKVVSSKALLYKKTKGLYSLESLLAKSVSEKHFKNTENLFNDKISSNSLNRSSGSQEDSLWQKNFDRLAYSPDGLFVNRVGLNEEYPSGDVGKHFFVQTAGKSKVAIFDKVGTLIEESNLNEIRGEEIETKGQATVLYDEEYGKWLFFEVTFNQELIITISKDENPLGEVTVYKAGDIGLPLVFTKYSIWTNTISGSTISNFNQSYGSFFLNRIELYNNKGAVSIQTFELPGHSIEGNGPLYLSPADWNGQKEPSDPRPVFLALNDSIWGGSEKDAIDLIRASIDWDNPENTSISKSVIPVRPFDSTPCDFEVGGCFVGFPSSYYYAYAQNIMAPPFYRAFYNHESLVFSFVVDVIPGENIPGIRWVELRKTASLDWHLYQEGTFAPKLFPSGAWGQRYMAGIAINKRGNIGMAYTYQREFFLEFFFTGRLAGDPLGIMTFSEYYVASEGNSGYISPRVNAALNVDPSDGETFWFTSAQKKALSKSRVVSFPIYKDSIDLGIVNFVDVPYWGPINKIETVTVEVKNNGFKPASKFRMRLFLDNEFIAEKMIVDTILPTEQLSLTFANELLITEPGAYELEVVIDSEEDQNMSNDGLIKQIERNRALDVSLGLASIENRCDLDSETAINLKFKNLGIDSVYSVSGTSKINGNIKDTLTFSMQVETGEEVLRTIRVSPKDYLDNFFHFEFKINSVNDKMDDFFGNDYLSIEVQDYKDVRAEFNLGIITDAFPEEISWEIKEIETQKVVAAYGPYEIPHDRINYSLCLSPYSCYIFKIFDSGGNGINCDASVCVAAYLAGNDLSFTLAGDFGYETSIGFCMGGDECYLDPSLEVMHPESANSSDGSININIENRVESFTYSIGNGVPFQQDPLFENLSAGTYYPEAIATINDCYFRDTIVLGFVNSSINIEHEKPQVFVRPNPNNGEFELELNGLNSNAELERIEIFNINGERLLVEDNREQLQSFSLADCNPGLYLIKCEISNQILISRFVIQ